MVTSLSLFGQINQPIGIATDLGGNVFVNSADPLLGSVLSKTSSAGAPLGQVRLPGGAIAGSYLALEPASGQILNLTESGQIQLIDPNTGAAATLLNIGSLPVDISNIYDVSTGQIDSFGGLIQPQFSSYGDIAVFSGNGFTDLYVSGRSQGQATPFVMRIQFIQGSFSSATVIASSRATAIPNEGVAPGIAVNSQGVVLTTLPISNGSGNYSVPFAFPTDLDLRNRSGSFNPTIIGNGSVAISSRGMTTDATGNFYIATGQFGGTLGGSGSIIVLSPFLDRVVDVIPSPSTAPSRDVAVSTLGDRAYATFDNNSVVVFPLVNAASSGTAGVAGAPELDGVNNSGAVSSPVTPAGESPSGTGGSTIQPVSSPGTPDADLLIGTLGNDRIVGTEANDRLFGNAGNDTLIGGKGNDLLFGGSGTNTLIGGKGRDIFVLEQGSGKSTVKDFRKGQDKLGLSLGLSFKNLKVNQRGDNVLISYDKDPLMLLLGAQRNQIKAAEFTQL